MCSLLLHEAVLSMLLLVTNLLRFKVLISWETMIETQKSPMEPLHLVEKQSAELMLLLAPIRRPITFSRLCLEDFKVLMCCPRRMVL